MVVNHGICSRLEVHYLNGSQTARSDALQKQKHQMFSTLGPSNHSKHSIGQASRHNLAWSLPVASSAIADSKICEELRHRLIMHQANLMLVPSDRWCDCQMTNWMNAWKLTCLLNMQSTNVGKASEEARQHIDLLEDTKIYPWSQDLHAGDKWNSGLPLSQPGNAITYAFHEMGTRGNAMDHWQTNIGKKKLPLLKEMSD